MKKNIRFALNISIIIFRGFEITYIGNNKIIQSEIENINVSYIMALFFNNQLTFKFS